MNPFTAQTEPTVEITRSFSSELIGELNDPGDKFSGRTKHGFFESRKMICGLSAAPDVSADLFRDCRASVLLALVDHAISIGARLPRLPGEEWTAKAINSSQEWLAAVLADRNVCVPSYDPMEAAPVYAPDPPPDKGPNPLVVKDLRPAQAEAPPPAPVAGTAQSFDQQNESGGNASTAGRQAGGASAPPESGSSSLVPDATASSETSFHPQPAGSDKAGTPPAEATRRRGRATPSKAQAESYSPEPPKEEPRSNVLPFMAGHDDLPVTIGPPPSQKERLLRAVDHITPGAKRDPDGGKATGTAWGNNKQGVSVFMRNLLGVDRLQTPQASVEMPLEPSYETTHSLDLLESMAKSYPALLKGDKSAASGQACRAGYNALVAALAKPWPASEDNLQGDALRPDVQRMAIAAAVAQYPDNPVDLMEFFDLAPVSWGADQLAFLGLLKRSKELARKVRDFANQQDRSIFELLADVDVEGAAESEILGKLK